MGHDPGTLVCLCMEVPVAEVCRVVKEKRLSLLREVAEVTGASTGCGRCAPGVTALIHQCAGMDHKDDHLAGIRGKSPRSSGNGSPAP